MRRTRQPVTERALRPPIRASREEFAAFRDAAIVVDRSDRRRWSITGDKASDVINGLVTNDVSQLDPGSGCYAAALTPKGKIVADLRILRSGDGFLVDTGSAAGPGWAEILRKYVNPRIAKYEDIGGHTVDITIAGPASPHTVAEILDLQESTLAAQAAFDHVALGAWPSLVLRTPEVGQPAYDILLPAGERDAVITRLLAAGVVAANTETWDVARVAHGWPEWGRDMDETTLAQEADLDRLGAISYDKGCYTGQETVARVHFRGHVNRYLRRARFATDVEVPAGTELHRDGKPVGDVRSSALTPESGVAIAMVRREVAGPALLRARWDGSEADVLIEAD
jgi:tRNA-modifying protein YgfZ